MSLEDHHIYPRAYITSGPDLDIDQAEAEQLVDCVANRTLILKLLNIHIGKQAPSVYLKALQKKNSHLATCLTSHLIPPAIIIQKCADQRAQLMGNGLVAFEGQQLPINRWGKQVTGWPSINIYQSVYLERTGKPLESLRTVPDQEAKA